MKPLAILLALLLLFGACSNQSKNKSDEKLIADSSATTESESDTVAIDRYVKEIKSKIPRLNYKRSLQYNLGDYTFDISTYFDNDNKQIALIEDGHRGEYGYRRLSVYYKNEHPVFAEVNEKAAMGSNNQYTEAKVYFKPNLKVIKALERKSLIENNIQDIPFTPFVPDTLGYVEKASFFKRVIDQTGEFDLPFEEIKKIDSREYLILGKNDPNSYHVKLLILAPDSTIKKLKANQAAFKGKKLGLTWDYENSKGYESLVYKSGQIHY
ncbi:hypothetical protein C3K47_07240 [Solitalea longa]|uniref:Lipoprotein n=2 Tax=Solitalea longa TaxID=2079460 RepID=A0A2S5A4N1_9SPHI|nr:hypothetical protein C3K47_07240 [Solitalea longa]